MTKEPLIYPLFAMVLLHLLVWIYLYTVRAIALFTGKTNMEELREGEAQKIPPSFWPTTNNFSNLFEMPVLFYAAILLIIHFKQTDVYYVYLAWGFVALRYLHSAIHTTYNKVLHRFSIYFISSLLLWGIWLRLFLNSL